MSNSNHSLLCFLTLFNLRKFPNVLIHNEMNTNTNKCNNTKIVQKLVFYQNQKVYTIDFYNKIIEILTNISEIFLKLYLKFMKKIAYFVDLNDDQVKLRRLIIFYDVIKM